MITGDHKVTASAIAKQIGIFKEGDLVMIGTELDKISDEELSELLPKISVYARVSPEHKIRIVRAWQEKGKIVATDCYQSAEAPHSVALASNKYSVKAGSDEVIRIEIDITDKNGIPCPYASNELSFHVSGPLRLLGVDNGNPTDMFPYQQPHCRCFRGKCVVLLQSDEEKGKGTLTVQGTKLVEKKLIIEVI
jgi:hypothetical protein